MMKQCEKTKRVGPRPLSLMCFRKSHPRTSHGICQRWGVGVSIHGISWRAPFLDGSKTLPMSFNMIASICLSLKESLQDVFDPFADAPASCILGHHFPKAWRLRRSMKVFANRMALSLRILGLAWSEATARFSRLDPRDHGLLLKSGVGRVLDRFFWSASWTRRTQCLPQMLR